MGSEEDAALFRASIGNVTPLTDQNRAAILRPSPATRVRSTTVSHTLPDTLSDSAPGNAPEEYLSNGVSRLALRKLRRCTVQDTLDLHGYQVDAARRLLQEFLHQALLQKLRCVLLIHGKGVNSPGGEAVLREAARNWLIQHPQVLAYCPAPVNLGGSGAVLVLLKSHSAD